MIGGEKYYKIEEVSTNLYICKNKKSRTPYLHQAESFSTKEDASNYVIGNYNNHQDYRIIDIAMSVRYV